MNRSVACVAALLLMVLAACVGRADDTGEMADGSAAEAVADAGVGQRLYRERCVVCHGIDGRGDGPAAAALRPPPRNFRDESFWRGTSLEAVAKVVREGRPGTLMQAFGEVFSDAEIEAVVAYVARFAPEGGNTRAGGRDGEAPGAGTGEDPAGEAPGP